MAYYKLVAIAEDGQASKPMIAPEAQRHDGVAFVKLYYALQLIDKSNEQQTPYYAIVKFNDDNSVSEPMSVPAAQVASELLFKRLFWLVKALVEREAAREAGQMDLFSGRPVNADAMTDAEIAGL
jgi:hypothetical protein